MRVSRRPLLGAPLPATPALGQERFPARPLRLVVPFPTGGPTGARSRLVAGRLGRELGQPVITENRGGADGFPSLPWNGIFTPAGLPVPILARPAEATAACLADPAFRATAAAQGPEPAAPGTPRDADAFIQAETDRYRPVVEAVRPELDT